MNLPEITFTVNGYDARGFRFEDGIYLHFGDTRIKVGNNMEEYNQFVAALDKMKAEISTYFPD